MEKKIVDILKQNHQEQLLEFLPILTPEEEKKLEQQIEKINFEQLQQLYESTKQKPQIEEKKHLSLFDENIEIWRIWLIFGKDFRRFGLARPACRKGGRAGDRQRRMRDAKVCAF